MTSSSVCVHACVRAGVCVCVCVCEAKSPLPSPSHPTVTGFSYLYPTPPPPEGSNSEPTYMYLPSWTTYLIIVFKRRVEFVTGLPNEKSR